MTQPAALLREEGQKLWQLISGKLQKEIPRQSFLTWFQPIEFLSFTNNILTLRVPSRFYRDWIESHYHRHMNIAIKDSIDSEIRVVYQVDSNVRVPRSDSAIITGIFPGEKSENRSSNPTRLNLSYCFDNFIQGDCNRFARSAALALAEAPGQTHFNPLLVYGGSGLGKTHLIQAIGNHVIEKGLTKRVLYVTSEQFTSDFIKAIQTNQSGSFSQIYRNVDVLLLDDVQFFMAKDKTQQEFFHTFNALHQDGKQLVFSSDRPPRELEGFDERLVSRLQWGLVAELQPPEYETRLAILKSLATEDHIELSDDVANFMATHVTKNIRSLQSAFIHLLAQASLIGKKLTMDLAREVVNKLGTHTTGSISIDLILNTVAKAYNFSSELLISKTRKREIVQARQVAMYLTTKLTNLTLKAIGLHFGGRDHSTVIHARDNVVEIISRNNPTTEMIRELHRRLELASL